MSSLNLSRIESQMVSRGFTQAFVAEALGVSREAVSQWLQGLKYPRPASLLALGQLLGLSHRDLVVTDANPALEPQFAFRTNRNRKRREEDDQAAADMAGGLELLVPYLPPAPITTPPAFAQPTTNRSFVLQAARYFQELLKAPAEGPVPLGRLFQGLADQGVILIPVLWGPRGHDGLFVRLPAAQRSFIYLNLDKKVTDFRFWLLHEWTHALAPGMAPDEAEALADLIPAEVLFPSSKARPLLPLLSGRGPEGLWVNTLLDRAQQEEISLVTVWRQVLAVAQHEGFRLPEIDIHPAEGNRLKSVPTVAQTLWGPQVDVQTFLDSAALTFHTPFFDALKQRLLYSKGGPNFVERVLRVPLGDAGGIHGHLTAR